MINWLKRLKATVPRDAYESYLVNMQLQREYDQILRQRRAETDSIARFEFKRYDTSTAVAVR